MKPKKIAVLLALGLAVTSCLFATELDQIIAGAKDKSPSYLNSLITYQNGLLNVRRLEESDKLTISLSATVDPLVDKGNDEYGISISPSATVVLPNDGKTTITAGLGYSTPYGDKYTSLSGNLGVNHSIDLNGYSDAVSKDLNYQTTKLSTELTFKRTDLSFEKTVISNVSALLNAEKAMEKARDTIAKQRTAIENMDILGTYSKTSQTYVRAVNSLKTLEDSLAASEQQLEDARYNYKVLTGLDWDYLDPLPEPVLELVTYDGGNTSVKLTSLAAESAAENYKATVFSYNPNTIALGATVSVYDNNVSTIMSPASTTYSIGGSAKYSASNWSVGVNPSLKIVDKSTSDTADLTPGITISGSWRNNTTSSAQEIQLQSLMNTAQSRQNDYIAAMSSYTQESQSLAVRVMNWNYRKAQAQANLDYLNMVLDNQKALFELGLASKTEVESAELDISQAMYDWNILILEGLSLQRDLEIFAL